MSTHHVMGMYRCKYLYTHTDKTRREYANIFPHFGRMKTSYLQKQALLPESLCDVTVKQTLESAWYRSASRPLPCNLHDKGRGCAICRLQGCPHIKMQITSTFFLHTQKVCPRMKIHASRKKKVHTLHAHVQLGLTASPAKPRFSGRKG